MDILAIIASWYNSKAEICANYSKLLAEAELIRKQPDGDIYKLLAPPFSGKLLVRKFAMHQNYPHRFTPYQLNDVNDPNEIRNITAFNFNGVANSMMILVEYIMYMQYNFQLSNAMDDGDAPPAKVQHIDEGYRKITDRDIQYLVSELTAIIIDDAEQFEIYQTSSNGVTKLTSDIMNALSILESAEIYKIWQECWTSRGFLYPRYRIDANF